MAESTEVESQSALPGARTALFLLVVVYSINFVDRQILSVLIEPIKTDLGLSDTQLGLLTGFAFAIFYATLGVPIGRLADRVNRVNIIAGAAALWSVMTALSGLAQNFWQLAAARVGVGVGEAGCTPPALCRAANGTSTVACKSGNSVSPPDPSSTSERSESQGTPVQSR